MAEITVGEPHLLRSKEKRHAAGCELPADDPCALFQPPQWVSQFAVSQGGSAHHQRALGYRIGDALEFLRVLEQTGCAHGGTRFAERNLVGIHDAQTRESEIAQGASRGADV